MLFRAEPIGSKDRSIVYGDPFSDVVRRVAAVPLFSRLGDVPVQPHAGRIASWDDWAGPEDDGAEAIPERQQGLHDELISEADEEAWLAALRRVVDHSAGLVGAEQDEDAWHAPTSAAWSAAWTFCLEAAHLGRGLPVPDDLGAQIAWYERGLWPCALAPGRDGCSPDDYSVF